MRRRKINFGQEGRERCVDGEFGAAGDGDQEGKGRNGRLPGDMYLPLLRSSCSLIIDLEVCLLHRKIWVCLNNSIRTPACQRRR